MDILNAITLLGSAIAFLFGIWKYLDTKSLKQKTAALSNFGRCSFGFQDATRGEKF